jgi:erythromycin esterase
VLSIRLARISMKMRTIILIFLISLTKLSFAQIESNTYQLNTLENLLTDDVKKIISYNIENKSVVFFRRISTSYGF